MVTRRELHKGNPMPLQAPVPYEDLRPGTCNITPPTPAQVHECSLPWSWVTVEGTVAQCRVCSAKWVVRCKRPWFGRVRKWWERT